MNRCPAEVTTGRTSAVQVAGSLVPGTETGGWTLERSARQRPPL